ncbi:hypothetical protein CEP51_011916 [Fusarium floridanum]|uniref:Rhodopsin domain-containing protein n=1 Tax=Fusarium floridanum TaxID=1325733 RepID=A0A428R4F1_9HYPO|nr:hypothetical protein CEP51_011916 [Fusarium floridanum]
MPATPFQTEAWTEYGLGSAVLFLRYFARWRTVGWKGMQGDDYFAFASLVFWTAELVMLELIGQNGTNIGVTDEMGAKLTDEQIAKLEFGSKCLLAGWNFYVTLIFCLKGVMLCFYSRMTLGLWQRKVVIWTQVGTVLAYGGVITVIWAHCTPAHKNWQVYPNPGGKKPHKKHSVSTLTGNICVYFGCRQLSYPGGTQHCNRSSHCLYPCAFTLDSQAQH